MISPVRTAPALALGPGGAALAAGAADAAGGGSSGSAAESVSGTGGGGAGTTGGSGAAAACVVTLDGSSLASSRRPLAKIKRSTASAAAASAMSSVPLLLRADGREDERAGSRAPSPRSVCAAVPRAAEAAWAAGSATPGFVVSAVFSALFADGSGAPTGFSAWGGFGRSLARISSSS